MEMLGVDPLRRIIAPRFWAGQISMPLLALIFSCVAIYGGHMVGVVWLGVDDGAYWANMQSSVDFYDDIVKWHYQNYRIWHGRNVDCFIKGIGVLPHLRVSVKRLRKRLYFLHWRFWGWTFC